MRIENLFLDIERATLNITCLGHILFHSTSSLKLGFCFCFRMN